MHDRRLLFTEPFDGLNELERKLGEIRIYASVNDHGSPAIESRALPVDRTLRPHVAVYEETLSDRSKQLVAVVVA